MRIAKYTNASHVLTHNLTSHFQATKRMTPHANTVTAKCNWSDTCHLLIVQDMIFWWRPCLLVQLSWTLPYYSSQEIWVVLNLRPKSILPLLKSWSSTTFSLSRIKSTSFSRTVRLPSKTMKKSRSLYRTRRLKIVL